MGTRDNDERLVFIVIVGKHFDEIKTSPAKPLRGAWLKRLLWWLIGTSAAAILGYAITKFLP